MKKHIIVLSVLAVFLASSTLLTAYSQSTGAQGDRSLGSAPKAETASLPVSTKRWALIIGVDQYKDKQIGPLQGAAKDARALATALMQYGGFPQDQVIVLATDQPEERQPTRVNILRRFSNLASLVPKDGLLLVSFAGHGMERSEQAFLLPSDAQVSNDVTFLEETAVSVTRMKDRIKAMGVKQVIVLLDACRNDPVGRADSANLLTKAFTRGLHFDVRNREVEAFAVLYATKVGGRAYEYSEKGQGYFTWAVVEGLKGAAANENGEVTLARLLDYVEVTVSKRSQIDLGADKKQIPFADIAGYKANELVIAVVSPESASGKKAESPAFDPREIELSFWETIKESSNPADFKAYLEKYPNGDFVKLAKSRLDRLEAKTLESKSQPSTSAAEIEFWKTINDSQDPKDFREYLKRYPNGEFEGLAKRRINAIEATLREAAGRAERDRLANIAAEKAKFVKSFNVRHAHAEFFKTKFASATFTVSPQSVEYRETGEDTNKEHDFAFPCSKFKEIKVKGLNKGELGTIKHYGYASPVHVFIEGDKKYRMFAERLEADAITQALYDICGRRK